jgi:hypothetical protein
VTPLLTAATWPLIRTASQTRTRTNDAADPNQEDDFDNPAPEGQVDPAAQNNDQTPGSIGSQENTSGGNTVSPSGSGNIQGNDTGGAESTNN